MGDTTGRYLDDKEIMRMQLPSRRHVSTDVASAVASDKLFWFNHPRLLLYMLKFVLFGATSEVRVLALRCACTGRPLLPCKDWRWCGAVTADDGGGLAVLFVVPAFLELGVRVVPG